MLLVHSYSRQPVQFIKEKENRKKLFSSYLQNNAKSVLYKKKVAVAHITHVGCHSRAPLKFIRRVFQVRSYMYSPPFAFPTAAIGMLISSLHYPVVYIRARELKM